MKNLLIFILSLLIVVLLAVKFAPQAEKFWDKLITEFASLSQDENFDSVAVHNGIPSKDKVSLSINNVVDSVRNLPSKTGAEKSEAKKNAEVKYRKFPYQQVINYKVNEVVLDDVVSHYTGGYLKYVDGKPCIVLNTFVLGENFKDSAMLAEFEPEFKYLNSSMRKQFTLYHEFTHVLNDVYHLQNLNRKDEILINKYDEISCCLSELLLAREIYLETSWDSIFPDKLSFYYDAIQAKKFVPNKSNISDAEAEFIINGLTQKWQEKLENLYADKEVSDNSGRTDYVDTPDLSEEKLKAIIRPFFAYEIRGQKINFLEYLKTKIELTTLELISVNSREIK